MSGSSSFTGIDPELLRTLGQAAADLGETASHEAAIGRVILNTHQLIDEAGDVFELCDELAEETGLLSEIAAQRATQISLAANGVYVPINTSLYDELRTSIHDGIGASDDVGTHELDPRLAALRAEIDANKEFSADWIEKKLEAAIEAGDLEAAHLLSEALWERVGAMEYEDAVEFLTGIRGISPEFLVLASELEPPPAIQAVAEALIIYARPDNLPVHIDSEIVAEFVTEHYGVTFDYTGESLATWSNDQLLTMSRRSTDAAQMILERGREWSYTIGHGMQDISPLCATLRQVAIENPTAFQHLMWDGYEQSQKIVDLLAIGATDEEMQKLLLTLAALTSETFEGPAEPGELGQYGGSAVDAVAIYLLCLEDVGHGVSFDWEALAKSGMDKAISAALKSVPLAGEALDQFYDLMKDFIVPDDVPKKRSDKDRTYEQQLTVAITILTVNEPEKAAALAKYVGDGPITKEKWSMLPPAGEDPLVDAARDSVHALMDQTADVII